MQNIINRYRLCVAAFLGVVTGLLVPALAMAQDTSAVNNGTAGLTSGVTTLTAFLYAALPILVVLAVASAIVRWVYRRVTSGAH
jgi:hypothetical protein